MLFPDFEILLFFIIPIKMKWIALIDAAFLIWTFILGDMSTKLTIAFCFVNLFLFLGKDIFVNIRYIYRKKFGGRKKTKEKRAKNIDISHRDK